MCNLEPFSEIRSHIYIYIYIYIYILSDNFCVQDMNTIKLLTQLLVPRTKAKVFHELSVSCSVCS